MTTAEQLARLQRFLDADDLHEEALDYVAAHGFLTALSIGPEQVPQPEWLQALFAEPPHYADAAEQAAIEDALVTLKNQIGRQLASDDDLQLPCALELGPDPDSSDLRDWCIGFMEGVFLRESSWFEESEEEVSELLIPIMVGSGLFEDQPEFAEMAQDPKLLANMLVQIPELLTELYLLFQAPKEKPVLLKPRH